MKSTIIDKKIDETLYFIDTGYACFGIISINNIVVDCAPIAKWSMGKEADYVINYFKNKKGAKVKTL